MTFKTLVRAVGWLNEQGFNIDPTDAPGYNFIHPITNERLKVIRVPDDELAYVWEIV